MEKITLNTHYISIQYPKAWKDFNEYYDLLITQEPEDLTNLSFMELPFELQLGCLYRYFREDNIELDLANVDYSYLPEIITEAFDTQEKLIKHHS